MAWSQRQMRVFGSTQIVVGIVTGAVTLIRTPFHPLQAVISALILLGGVGSLKKARAQSGS